jgi:hypothetical protein
LIQSDRSRRRDARLRCYRPVPLRLNCCPISHDFMLSNVVRVSSDYERITA